MSQNKYATHQLFGELVPLVFLDLFYPFLPIITRALFI